MTTLDNIQSSLSEELIQLNGRISTALYSSNLLMNSVIEGYLKSKGKQIRPILVILSAKLFGDVNPDVISSAAAVEMLHNASLIHDDVIDESKLRHGHPTINSVWDNHIAVLVGDFFVSNALSQAIATGDIRIVNSIARLGKLLSLGEIDQIYNARSRCLDEKAYFEIISRKTASLFVSCVEMGAYSVGIDEADPRLDRMRRFAELLGLCFQIKDDIFDYYSASLIGKPTGNDLKEGKITLPLLHALETTRDGAMIELSHKEQLQPDEISRLIRFAKENGGIDYARDTMQRLRDEAVEAISGVGDSEVTALLVSILDFIIAREK